MEILDSTIKRLYDEYKPQDYSYGDNNLNPKREMILDQMAIIEKKVQEVTNDIVLKKIRKPKEPEQKVAAPVNGEKPTSKNAARKEVANRAGSPTLDIFDMPNMIETIVGSFPGSINELSLPPIVDCEEILKKYDFESNYTIYTSVFEDEPVFEIKITPQEGSEPEDPPPVEEDDELEECADVELEFLKIILIILKIIRTFIIIIDYVISTVAIIIQIICLAVGAWLNPPNVSQIVQIVMSLIIALVVQIISKLIAMIFSLLNFDCIADQTMQIIAQIQEAMNAFKSTMSMLNPSAVSFFGDLMDGGIEDIKQIIKDLLDEKAEAWKKAKKELSQTFSKDGLKKMSDKMLDEAQKAAIEAADQASNGKTTALFNAVSGTVGDAIQISKDAKKKVDEMVTASVDAYNAIMKGINGGKTQNAAINRVMSDSSMKGISME